MADRVIVTKDETKSIMSDLMNIKAVYAPLSNGKKLDYMRVTDVNEVTLDDELPYKSPKELFFPRLEKIITFKDGEAVAEMPNEQVVLFGARPCDLEALEIMKKVFTKGKFKDPYFETRYNNTLLIGIACVGKKPGCFCDERETDMAYCDKCDLFLGVNGDGYEVLYASEKGRKELNKYIVIDDFKNRQHDFNPSKTISIEASENDMFNRVDWEKKVEICQGCCMCTYICPTCHCFVFKDMNEGGCAHRYRNWDSCMFPKFTLHASGHNPRTEKHERYRQRLAHKYLYVRENFGSVACTGCGRCVRGCPAGVSIKAVAEGIMEELK